MPGWVGHLTLVGKFMPRLTETLELHSPEMFLLDGTANTEIFTIAHYGAIRILGCMMDFSCKCALQLHLPTWVAYFTLVAK